MGHSLQRRIDRIAQHVAPIFDRKRERLAEVAKVRAYIQPDVDGIMGIAAYCGLAGVLVFREQLESDMVEATFLELAEYCERFGEAERTHERTLEAVIQADIKFYREIYGLEFGAADVMRANDQGDQVREDMRDGVPASESKVAQEVIRNEARRPARLKKHTDDFAAFIAGHDSRIPDCVFNDSLDLAA